MRKIGLALFSFFVWSSLLAQTTGGLIEGSVKGSDTHAPIGFATVDLYQNDRDVAMKSLMADLEGNFTFRGIPFGSYRIQISYVGYRAKTIANILIAAEHPQVTLGAIHLLVDSATTLKEVSVTANKPLIEFGADSIIFNVEQSIHAEGSTVSDLLKSVPMVNVDIDGSPTIAGQVSTRIFINGKPSDYTAETVTDLLNVLPSEAIQKIEVITNPEEQYGADGDGIINIVLKKGYQLGLSSGISATTSSLGVHKASAYAGYSDSTIHLTGHYGYRINRRKSQVDLKRTNFNVSDEVTSYMNQSSHSYSTGHGHNGRAALDWDITPMQNVSASANYNEQNRLGDTYLDDYRLNAAQVQTRWTDQENSTGNDQTTITFDADYKLEFNRDKRESLSAGMDFFNRGNRRDRLLQRVTNKINSETADLSRQYRSNEIGTSRLAFHIDYVKPLSKRSRILVGSKITMGNNSNDQWVSSHDFEHQQDTVVGILTNTFDYRQNIYAGYASYRLSTQNSWSFRVGARYEWTDIQFKQRVDSGLDPTPYYSIFPNFSIYKSYKKKSKFGFSYNMRLVRPRANALNPLVDNTNPSNVRFGNPNLRPSYINQFQLSFGTAGERWSFTPRLRYAATTRIIESFRISADSVTFANLGSNRALTMHLFGNYRYGKAVMLTGEYMLSRRSYQSESLIRPSRIGYSQRVNITLSGQLPYNIAFEGQFKYFANALAQGRNLSSSTTSFAVRKNFFRNKLIARLVTTDPFANHHTNQILDVLTSSGTSYYQERDAITHTTNYAFTLSYRFSKPLF